MRGAMIVGRLATGIGQGQHFTRLAWARGQFIEKLGIDPFPGTVNLIVDDPASRAAWDRLKGLPVIRIDNPGSGPHDCDAVCHRVVLEGRLTAAIVLPEVAGYPAGQIEIIAAVNIRDTLSIADGDQVRLEHS